MLGSYAAKLLVAAEGICVYIYNYDIVERDYQILVLVCLCRAVCVCVQHIVCACSYAPAYKVSYDIGVAYNHFSAAVFLSRRSTMEVLPESCLYSGTITIKLLKLVIMESDQHVLKCYVK